MCIRDRLSTPPAFVLSQDQTLRQELPVSVKFIKYGSTRDSQ
jgi:hypothetical protein